MSFFIQPKMVQSFSTHLGLFFHTISPCRSKKLDIRLLQIIVIVSENSSSDEVFCANLVGVILGYIIQTNPNLDPNTRPNVLLLFTNHACLDRRLLQNILHKIFYFYDISRHNLVGGLLDYNILVQTKRDQNPFLYRL